MSEPMKTKRFYCVRGKKIALQDNPTTKFVRQKAGKGPSDLKLGKTSQLHPRIAEDATPVGANVYQSASVDEVEQLCQHDSVDHVRCAFRDPHGLEVVLTDSVLVRFKKGVPPGRQIELLSKYGKHSLTHVANRWTVEIDDPAQDAPLDVANELDEIAEVEWAMPNAIVESREEWTPPNDPLRAEQWHLDTIGVPDVWKQGILGTDVRIAVIDRGVDPRHPDLMANLLAGKSFDGLVHYQPDQWHGTACAGLIAATWRNGLGVVGVAPESKIVPVRVPHNLSVDQWGEVFRWARNNADMVSLSMTIVENPDAEDAIEELHAAGKPVFCAAGNDNTHIPGVGWPASIPVTTVGVGASTLRDTVSSKSKRGVGLDLLAPSDGFGRMIATTDNSGQNGHRRTASPVGDYLSGNLLGFGGTSAATAIAAGVGALVLSANRNLHANDVRQIMVESCLRTPPPPGHPYGPPPSNSYGPPQWSRACGYGRINASRAVQAALQLRP